MPTQQGERVFAITHADASKVYLLGFGVYEGPRKHPEYGFENPMIKLDSGKVAWGLSCWWGPEDIFQKRFGKLEIVNLDPTESQAQINDTDA